MEDQVVVAAEGSQSTPESGKVKNVLQESAGSVEPGSSAEKHPRVTEVNEASFVEGFKRNIKKLLTAIGSKFEWDDFHPVEEVVGPENRSQSISTSIKKPSTIQNQLPEGAAAADTDPDKKQQHIRKELFEKMFFCLESFRDLSRLTNFQAGESASSKSLSNLSSEPIKYRVKYNEVKALLRQLRLHVLYNQIHFLQKKEADKDKVIQFLWRLIQPHLDDEGRKAKLIGLFLETCLLLQIFKEGFFHLESAENSVKGIREIENEIIRAQQDHLGIDSSESDLSNPEESEGSKQSSEQAIQSQPHQKTEPRLLKLHWLLFMKVFDLERLIDDKPHEAKMVFFHGLEALQNRVSPERDSLLDVESLLILKVIDKLYLPEDVLRFFQAQDFETRIIKNLLNIVKTVSLKKSRQINIKKVEGGEIQYVNPDYQEGEDFAVSPITLLACEIQDRIQDQLCSDFSLNSSQSRSMHSLLNLSNVSDSGITSQDKEQQRRERDELYRGRLQLLIGTIVDDEEDGSGSNSLDNVNVAERLEEVDPDRFRLHENGIYNKSNQTTLKRLVLHIETHVDILQRSQHQPDKIDKVYGGKRDMARTISYYALTYLRGLRAYHLREFLPEDGVAEEIEDFDAYLKLVISKLPEQAANCPLPNAKDHRYYTVAMFVKNLHYLLFYLLDCQYEPCSRLIRLSEAFKKMIDHLEVKGSGDPNLIDNESFHRCLDRLRDLRIEFSKEVGERKRQMDEGLLRNFTNAHEIQQQYRSLVYNSDKVKSFSHVVSTFYEQYCVRFVNQQLLLQSIKVALAGLFDVEPKDLDVGLYGLSGSGFQFRGNQVKIMCRHKRFSDLSKRVFKDLQGGNIHPEDPANLPHIKRIKQEREAEKERLQAKLADDAQLDDKSLSHLARIPEESDWKVLTAKSVSKVNPHHQRYEVNSIYLFKEFKTAKEVIKAASTRPANGLEVSSSSVDNEPLTLVVKVKMESPLRVLETKRAELISLYSTRSSRFRKIATFVLVFARLKQIIGKEYLSSTGLLLLLIAFLQKEGALPNYQNKQELKERGGVNISKRREKLPRQLYGGRKMQHLRFQNQLANFDHELLRLEQVDDDDGLYPKELTVDYFIGDNDLERTERMQILRERLMSKKAIKDIPLLARFIRFIVLKIPNKPRHVSIKKAAIRKDKNTRMLLSIKDPFIGQLNHGVRIPHKNNFKRFIREFADLLREASENNALAQIYAK